MIVFPIITAVISAMCAGVLAYDAKRRPRPDKIVWAIAFLAFTVAAASDAAGRAIEWTTWLARTYYSTGPALVVMYLAIGELYLLVPKQMARFGVGATLLLTAFWIAMVYSAPIDHARLADDGWEAIKRGTVMTLITVLINSIGTTIIVGGTGYSVWNFWRKGIMRNRMIGCALIALGTIAVGAGGTLTRLGHYEYLYIAMSIGVAMIFAGVLQTRRPDVVVAAGVAAAPATASATVAAPAPVVAHTSASSLNGAVPSGDTPASVDVPSIAATGDPIAYIEGVLLPLRDHELARTCAEWSVPRDDSAVLTRSEARHVWRLRSHLSAEGMRGFDAHTVMARRQLTVLWDEVLTANVDAPIADAAPVSQALPPPAESRPEMARLASMQRAPDMTDEDEIASTYA
ncbi:MAG TPA: hypothetical protein VFQ54_08930 [Thermomicrobiales bacterium]|nr:hypothetical protein [Thermomicrobiales bacterium]